MENKYYVIVLPMDLEGTVNRQIYECEDLETAKSMFHTQCAKYFKNANVKLATVHVMDIFANKVVTDYWRNSAEE